MSDVARRFERSMAGVAHEQKKEDMYNRSLYRPVM